MRSIPSALLAGLVLLAGSGCGFIKSGENEPLDPAVLQHLEPGTTTARKATELLGGPMQVIQLGQRTAYLYEHLQTKGAGLLLPPFILAGADTRADRLWLFFDSNDVLTHYGASFQGHRPQYALPWDDVYEAEDDAAADAARPGLPVGTRTGGGDGS